ncbi:30S ribosomal protein S4 [Lentisphaera profundi]|uniref:Small ribosomal subunit protein uS4 n=1 Tax=Lentisphaera profundi TaxID=1658616 RepID=A0ABY7VYH8_9BACT|nr:30S ribosomal protein S4 [Lentisphaera profundi]WDE97917.1 30S ribosomal protein S4 [Lentisphaera profundi]
MGKYSGNKGKICRRFGVNLFGNMKYDKVLAKRPNPPGVHGANAARKKLSEYGKQLIEKQKLKITYGLREKQFRITFDRAAKLSGVTGNNLMILLEARLDNVVYRLGFAPTRSAARQLVGHGHVRINGRRCNISSYSVRPGDVVTLKDSSRSKALVQRHLDGTRGETPEWVSLIKDELKGEIVRLPEREEIPSVADELMVVELYSK